MMREFSNRIEKLRKVMERNELNALLLINPRNVYYITGFSSMMQQLPVALLVSREGEPSMILPQIELERSHESSWISNVRPYAQDSPSRKNAKEGSFGSKAFMSEVQSLVKSSNLSSATMGIEFSYMTVSTFEMLRSGLEKTGFKDVSEDLLEIRSVKDYEEVETLRDSLEISERGIRTAIELVQPGITELDVAAEVERIVRKAGSKRTAFDSKIASGLKSGQRLTSAEQKRIDANEFVAIDVSAIYNEYCSDVARTIYTGRPGEKHKKAFQLSKRVLAKTIEQIRPGITSGEIAASVRNFLGSLEVEDGINISGHGIGLELYEYPRIFENEMHLIKTGSIICVKVETSIREVGGIKIAETLLVTNDGVEVLNKLPIETI